MQPNIQWAEDTSNILREAFSSRNMLSEEIEEKKKKIAYNCFQVLNFNYKHRKKCYKKCLAHDCDYDDEEEWFSLRMRNISRWAYTLFSSV